MIASTNDSGRGFLVSPSWKDAITMPGFSFFQRAPSITSTSRRALRFILLLGGVSLLADMTYEGARSINGPFLALLGANSIAVGAISGLGELIGYGIRLISGYVSERSQRYWLITLIGYSVNLLAVPLLALSGHWVEAAILMIIERTGKGIRVPPRDAMLSYAAQQVGRGLGFGIHEALDQIGAILGPLLMAGVLAVQGNYRYGYALLVVPTLLALSVLAVARWLYPDPQALESPTPLPRLGGFSGPFWVYVIATGCIAAGFADFPLIAYHFQKTVFVPAALVPVFYALAMGVDALAALVFGRLFDRLGLVTMMLVAFVSAFFAPLVFLGNLVSAGAGMILWGVGMGAQESIMRAAVAEMVAPAHRALAYGIFNTCYGLFWFGGSLLIGYLYDVSLPMLVLFSMVMQLIAIPLFFLIRKKEG